KAQAVKVVHVVVGAGRLAALSTEAPARGCRVLESHALQNLPDIPGEHHGRRRRCAVVVLAGAASEELDHGKEARSDNKGRKPRPHKGEAIPTEWQWAT